MSTANHYSLETVFINGNQIAHCFQILSYLLFIMLLDNRFFKTVSCMPLPITLLPEPLSPHSSFPF